MVHSFSSPSPRYLSLSLSHTHTSGTLPFSFSAKHPTNPNGESKQQWQQEHQCNTALRCSESKRAPVGGPRAWKKFCKSTMMEHVLRRLKVDDFSSILRARFPRAHVKVKKTRDSSGSRLRDPSMSI